MSVIDEVLQANREYARDFGFGHLGPEPTRRLAVLACMDSRQPIKRMLGLDPGEAHLLRNAGAIVTEDVLRSLLISHHIKGTREFMVVAHTECGMQGLAESGFRERLERQSGRKSEEPARFHSFHDLDEHVRRQLERVRAHPWLAALISVRGFVYDVKTGLMREVPA